VSHLLPSTIKRLHCNANITLQFSTVTGRDREGDTYLCTDYGLLECNLADGCQYNNKDGGSSWYVSIILQGVTSQKTHCCEKFNVRNLLQNHNLITINTATKLNLHDQIKYVLSGKQSAT
jgi:hypothetical protein